jgi:hypothetical protein
MFQVLVSRRVGPEHPPIVGVVQELLEEPEHVDPVAGARNERGSQAIEESHDPEREDHGEGDGDVVEGIHALVGGLMAYPWRRPACPAAHRR